MRACVHACVCLGGRYVCKEVLSGLVRVQEVLVSPTPPKTHDAA